MAKLFAVRTAINVVLDALNLLGGAALTEASSVKGICV